MKSNEKGRTISDPSLDLENSLGLLFDFFSSKLKLTNKSFRLYGHSGCSQFVHRYLLFSEETSSGGRSFTKTKSLTILS